ncbi:hypothetical protein AOLI_G00234110 [Acnodon oligacanthus]
MEEPGAETEKNKPNTNVCGRGGNGRGLEEAESVSLGWESSSGSQHFINRKSAEKKPGAVDQEPLEAQELEQGAQELKQEQPGGAGPEPRAAPVVVATPAEMVRGATTEEKAQGGMMRVGVDGPVISIALCRALRTGVDRPVLS